MAENTINCPACGVTLAYDEENIGMTLECPSCQGEFELVDPNAASPEEEATAETVESVPEPVGSAPLSVPQPGITPPALPETGHLTAPTPAEDLPEHMKANKLVAGRTCPKCGGIISFGENVVNCQDCGTTSHETCHREDGCVSEKCRAAKRPTFKKRNLPGTAAAGGAPGGGPAADMKECDSCGEMIKRRARKCRFCGEYQGAHKKLQEKRSYADDDNLSIWEIIFAILCGGIACIVGIVYICQGKKKGWKLILVSIIANVIWRVLIAGLSQM